MRSVTASVQQQHINPLATMTKLIALLALLLLAVAAKMLVNAQFCGEPVFWSCFGEPRSGVAGPDCVARSMWYFHSANNTCLPLNYLGCGGNRNRHCVQEQCELRCRRVFPNPTPPP